MSQKLSPADRKEAKEAILNHVDNQLHEQKCSKKIATEELKKLKARHTASSRIIQLAHRKYLDSIKALKKTVGPNFEVSDSGKISISYRAENYIAMDKREATEKKNKPIIAKRRKSLAKLQTIETREDLNKLFTSLGIL